MASASTSDVDPTTPPPPGETIAPASSEYAASEPSDIVELLSPAAAESEEPPASGRVQTVLLELNGVQRTLPLPWSGELFLRGSESFHIVGGPLTSRVRLRIDSSPDEGAPGRGDLDRKPSLREEIAALTALRIKEALVATGGNQTHAARLIGMPLRTFVSRLKALRPSSEDPE